MPLNTSTSGRGLYLDSKHCPTGAMTDQVHDAICTTTQVPNGDEVARIDLEFLPLKLDLHFRVGDSRRSVQGK